MTNIGLLHEISATFINICINLMRVYQKHAQMLCKIDRKDAGPAIQAVRKNAKPVPFIYVIIN